MNLFTVLKRDKTFFPQCIVSNERILFFDLCFPIPVLSSSFGANIKYLKRAGASASTDPGKAGENISRLPVNLSN